MSGSLIKNGDNKPRPVSVGDEYLSIWTPLAKIYRAFLH